MLAIDEIRQLIETLREAWEVPGVALAILKDDEILLAEGFGWRDRQSQLPVTPGTLFCTGSVTKSFVALGMGLLVEAGKLQWDRPVRDYLPWFRLYDAFASERITPRDLLTHRSGLPRHEKSWYGSPYSRRELIERLRYLQPNADLRTLFQYQNMMYVTAGYLIGEIAGTDWETFTYERILQPLGMTASNLSTAVSQRQTDYARPYLKKIAPGSEVELTPFFDNDTCAPAGALNSNLTDMLKWLRLHLNGGKVGDTQFIAQATLTELHTPQILIQDPTFRKLQDETFLAYGMGWFIQPYQGRTLLRHGGNIDGFATQVAFMPQAKLGIVVYANLNESPLPGIVLYSVLDRLLGVEPIDWHSRVKALVQQDETGVAESRRQSEARRVPNTQPTHPLEAFCGDYEHPGYGVLRVEKTNPGALQVFYNGLPSPLTHYHYNIFELYNELYEDNKWIKASFQTGLDGQIESVVLRMELASGIDPIRFERRQIYPA